MIGRNLDLKKDSFHPRDDGEDILEAKVIYLSAIRPDIFFAVNLLVRVSIVI
jgi:hypothetical protein